MRLIDATRIEQYILNNCSDNEEINSIYAEIINASTVDVVEVVRCKDCKFWHEDVANFISSIPRGGCKLVRGITNGEFFCALGERKEPS
jgi:hypothetical protein